MTLKMISDRLQARACRDIKAGEEILTNYHLDLERFPTRAERQQWFLNWQFACRCEVCSLTGESLESNEQTRQQLTHLQDLIRVNKQAGQFKEALELANKVTVLFLLVCSVREFGYR